ncbi:MAG: hypothetical protein ACR2NN_04485 [Bryobacteraceae bacterium]
MRSFWRGVVSLLKELSDENAYQRHLIVHHRSHSPEEWRVFLDERLRKKFSQGKCC